MNIVNDMEVEVDDTREIKTIAEIKKLTQNYVKVWINSLYLHDHILERLILTIVIIFHLNFNNDM